MISLNGFLVFLTSNALIESKYWSWNVDAGFSPCQVRLNLWLMTRRSLREMCIQLAVFRCIWLARHWDVNHSEWSLKEKNVNIWSGHSTNMWSCVLLTTYSLLSLSIITAFCKISGMQCILGSSRLVDPGAFRGSAILPNPSSLFLLHHQTLGMNHWHFESSSTSMLQQT